MIIVSFVTCVQGPCTLQKWTSWHQKWLIILCIYHTVFGNKVGIVEEYLLHLKKEKKNQFTSSSQIQCVDINKLKGIERLWTLEWGWNQMQ
jgi:hypothetical protein